MRKRASGVELLRIIAMIMIIGEHYVSYGICHGISGDNYQTWSEGYFINRVFSAFLFPGGLIGVGLFFMITGYFMIDRDTIKLKKIVLQTMFYGVFSLLIGAIAYWRGFSFSAIGIKSLASWGVQSIFTPLTGNLWWFVSAYFFLILLHPLLNRIMRSLNRKGQLIVILLLGFFGYIIDGVFGSAYGSLERAAFFYLLGGYIHKNEVLKQVKQKRIQLIVLTFAAWGLGAVFYYIMNICMISNGVKYQILYLLCEILLRAISVTVCSVCFFLLFLGMHFTNAIVNKIAATTFGVYLIHEGLFARWWLWKGLLKVDTVQYASPMFIFWAIGSIVLVFAVCSVIDLVRISFLEKPTLSFADRIITNFHRKFAAVTMK